MRIISSSIILAVVACTCSMARATPVYTLSTLASFDNTNGNAPYGGLVFDANGNLYGTTTRGGANGSAYGGWGTVFEVAAGTHALTTLVSFDTNGHDPYGQLTVDATGNLYGTTGIGGPGGSGTVFEVAAGTHALTTLSTFVGTDGQGPNGGLIFDATGNLYGTTQTGGSPNYGTVFEVAAGTHALTTLATFNIGYGENPQAGLIADANGNLYGTASVDGVYDNGSLIGDGTIFKVAARTHALTTPVTFTGANGVGPSGSLIADANGNLYGTTAGGGTNSVGTVFELNPNTDALTTLFSFNGTNGDGPLAALVFGPDGNLYGTTSLGGADGDGTVFELNSDTDALTTLLSFSGMNGENPGDALIFDASGNLYGTTEGGGADGFGEAFELSPVPVPEPPSLALGLLALAVMAAATTLMRHAHPRPLRLAPLETRFQPTEECHECVINDA